MSRGLSAGALDVVQGDVVVGTMAVDLAFDGGPVRWNGGQSDIVIGSTTYLGIGTLGSISPIEETADLQAAGMTVQVSGIPRDMVTIALAEYYQNRPATIYRIDHAPDDWATLYPYVLFRGRMDQMDIQLGRTAMVTIRLQNRLADWARPRLRRYTDEDQRRLYPDDGAFSFVSATTEKTITW